ncbi:dihydropteroate synthase [Paracoccus sp. TK19116]|uniref:Dihydropteroate synthase n=1 Tax=Paracoccus albicereus TaxID=2922394 RepID=A0ABT1MTV3_9RHOB|nr:dihydropteroate synthase [Paracoccus albicereus]MCQ0971735.1 dihydropteroate synthase [Paracoccus albicereus]
MSRVYYRPIPEPETGSLIIAGGWTRASRFERLERGCSPVIVDDAPDAVIEALTAPRAPLVGLSLDRPRLMGIVNATPDSFSDGGAYEPLEQARRLTADGTEILDIGGESTRPGATELPVEEEIARVRPVIASMRYAAPVSIDTRKAAVARAALDEGAVMVNDVSGFDFDPALAGIVADAGVPVCLMHAQGLPDHMQDDPRYDDVLLDVYDALEQRVERAEAAGISRDRIVIDPGIGFGKTMAHNLAILRRISLYHGLGCAVLLGASRKRFIGTIGGAENAAERMPGTLAVTLAAVAQGVQVHRVHDVAEVRQALALWRAAAGEDGYGQA